MFKIINIDKTLNVPVKTITPSRTQIGLPFLKMFWKFEIFFAVSGLKDVKVI